MIETFASGRVRSWASILDDVTREQAAATSRLSILPDKHGMVKRGVFDRAGRVQRMVDMPLVEELAEDIAAWWAAGEES